MCKIARNAHKILPSCMVYVFMTTFHVYNVFVANVQSGEKMTF